MGRSRTPRAPARALSTLAISLLLAAGACSSGAKSHGKPGVTAIQQIASDAGAAVTDQTATQTATSTPADAAAIPDYATWSTPRLEQEIVRLKKTAPTYENLTAAQRAELRAAMRALDVRRSHPLPEDRPRRGSIPGTGPKSDGGAK